jgi:SnoaL-like domain
VPVIRGPRRAGTVAAALRTAFSAADLDLLADLLHPDVRWGGDEDTADTCRDREAVLAWYGGLLRSGVRATVDEVVARDSAILLGLTVSWPDEAGERPTLIYQVFRLDRGLIVDIRGYPDRDDAMRAANPHPHRH